MGVVYAGYDILLDRKVAIKLVRPQLLGNAAVRARMIREAQAMARLSSPHVVQVFQVGEFHDSLYLAMEYVEGQTLTSWLTAAPRPWQVVLRTVCDAGRGLAAAHSAGLVHRDFKPESGLRSQVSEITRVSRLRRGCVPSLYQADGPVKTAQRFAARHRRGQRTHVCGQVADARGRGRQARSTGAPPSAFATMRRQIVRNVTLLHGRGLRYSWQRSLVMHEAILGWSGILIDASRVLSLPWEQRVFCCPICGAQVSYRAREGSPHFSHERLVNPACPWRTGRWSSDGHFSMAGREARSVRMEAFWRLLNEIGDCDLALISKSRDIFDLGIAKILCGKGGAYQALEGEPLTPLESNALNIFYHPYFSILPRWAIGRLVASVSPEEHAVRGISTADVWGEFLGSDLLRRRGSSLSEMDVRRACLQPLRRRGDVVLDHVDTEHCRRFMLDQERVEHIVLDPPVQVVLRSHSKSAQLLISVYKSDDSANQTQMGAGELALEFSGPFGMIVSSVEKNGVDFREHAGAPALLYVSGHSTANPKFVG